MHPVRVVVVVVLLLLVSPACGTPPVPATAPAAAESAAPEPVADPAQRTGDLGAISFPATGAAAAQDDFRRGVAWLHSFGYEDAIEAFQAAQAKDPGFTLAYWGESLAYSQPLWFEEELDKGRAALAKLAPTPAARRALARTPREQAFLGAVEVLWGEGDRPARAAAYAEAMSAVAAAEPADDEAQVFYALALLATMPRGDLSLPIREKAGGIVEAVFARNPRHPGAAHLILHAYDHGTLAARGLAAARAYAAIAPAASHALHMPAHFFVQLGHWQEAAASDATSWQASVDWGTRSNKPVTLRDFHSLVWWQYELTQLGQFDQALQVAREVDVALAVAGEQEAIGGHRYADSDIGRGSGRLALQNDKGSMRARYVLESERWQEMAGQSSFDNIDELFVLGVSALRLNDPPRARAAYQELARATAPGMDAGLREQASILLLEIEAIAAIMDGTPAVAWTKMDEATAMQAKMPKPIGRPFPVKGADELYGELLLEAGRAGDAVGWFERTLLRTPNRSRAVLGLARAAAKSGQADKSRIAYTQFLANWADADPGLPELAEATRALGR